MLGTNYRMTEIQAAIGIVQLNRLAEFFKRRSRNASLLTKLLEEEKKITLPPKLETTKHSWYLYTVRINDITETKRNSIIQLMHEKGIGAEAYYPIPVHKMPYYQENFGIFDLPETELAAKQVISLPIHPSVTEMQIDNIAQMFLSLL
jgi:dTDP-4-amino-4,6-dideoxygalactose transaminase